MTDLPREFLRLIPTAPLRARSAPQQVEPDTEALLSMAARLGPRDLAVLAHIVRRAAEICESDGEETALAVLDQIEAILRNRAANG